MHNILGMQMQFDNTLEDPADIYKIYIIPKNVKARFELFPGIGIREIVLIAVSTLVGLCIGLVIFLLSGSLLWVGLALPPGAFMYLVCKPNPRTGRNMMQIMTDKRKFNSRPKRYDYRYGSGRGY